MIASVTSCLVCSCLSHIYDLCVFTELSEKNDHIKKSYISLNKTNSPNSCFVSVILMSLVTIVKFKVTTFSYNVVLAIQEKAECACSTHSCTQLFALDV